DGDVRVGDLAGDAGEESGEAGPRTGGHVQPGQRRLHRGRGDVDDPPEPPLDHAVQHAADHRDGRDHVVLDAVADRVVVDGREVAEGRAAVVVDEDVDLVVRGGDELALDTHIGDASGDGADLGACAVADVLRG